MYKCNYCDRYFDEPAVHTEYHSEVNHCEHWYCCPHCGEASFDEVEDEEDGEEDC